MIRLLLLLLAALALGAQDRPALDGLDPVLLTEGKDADGRESLTARHEGFLYHFASEETRVRFLKDPARYGIQLGGACARMGAPVSGDPGAYHVHGGRIYIFGSTDCYQRFKAAPDRYLESGVTGFDWQPTPAATADATQAWARLLEALGGADNWRLAQGLVERRGAQVRTFRGGDSLRVDGGSGDRAFSNVTTPAAAFSVFRGEARRARPATAQATLRMLARDIFPLLRGPEPEMYATGARDGLLWLRLRRDGVLLDAALDPATGRLTRLAYVGRNGDGEAGRIELAYSDFRAVGGLLLPHKLDGTFRGERAEALSAVIDSYELNPADLEARFAVPPQLGGN